MPYLRGREIQEGPDQVPANPKLWNMYVAQAKARFRKWPSPTASAWVHAEYSKVGGKFVDKESEVDPRFRDYAEEARKEKLNKIKKQVKKNVRTNGLPSRQFNQ